MPPQQQFAKSAAEAPAARAASAELQRQHTPLQGAVGLAATHSRAGKRKHGCASCCWCAAGCEQCRADYGRGLAVSSRHGPCSARALSHAAAFHSCALMLHHSASAEQIDSRFHSVNCRLPAAPQPWKPRSTAAKSGGRSSQYTPHADAAPRASPLAATGCQVRCTRSPAMHISLFACWGEWQRLSRMLGPDVGCSSCAGSAGGTAAAAQARGSCSSGAAAQGRSSCCHSVSAPAAATEPRANRDRCTAPAQSASVRSRQAAGQRLASQLPSCRS
jgi:hypothetical protein